MTEDRKTTAPIPPVGADGEQPIRKTCNISISEIPEELNSQVDVLEKDLDMDRLMAQLNNPNYLRTVSMNQLYDTSYQSRPPVIEGLLHSGTYIFAGAPKVGKSFFMGQLAYHVSTGKQLWGHEINPGTVLYLALEDDYQRLQERMYRMFGVDGTDKLHFAVCAKSLGKGLDEQLADFLRNHPDTRLIIIDTLQKIREVSGETYSYANDYDVISQLKRFADSKGICLILVHHTRKQSSGDKFDMISGTNGILGSADGSFLLHKEKRTDLNAILQVVGRDQPDQKLYLIRDQERLCWNLDHAETELWEKPKDPLLEKIASILTEESPTWQGSAAELVALLGDEIQPNILTRKLNVKAGDLLAEHGVNYQHKHTRSGSHICLSKQAL